MAFNRCKGCLGGGSGGPETETLALKLWCGWGLDQIGPRLWPPLDMEVISYKLFSYEILCDLFFLLFPLTEADLEKWFLLLLFLIVGWKFESMVFFKAFVMITIQWSLNFVKPVFGTIECLNAFIHSIYLRTGTLSYSLALTGFGTYFFFLAGLGGNQGCGACCSAQTAQKPI